MGLKARATRSSEQKTLPSAASVEAFVASVEDPGRRRDTETVLAMMRRITGEEPVLWGSSIIGFGRYDYRYASGRSGTWPRTGLSPRRSALTVYIMPGFDGLESLLDQLGRHKRSVSCLYIPDLGQVDHAVLAQIIAAGWKEMARRYS